MFHVSLLKKAVGSYQGEEKLPDHLEVDFPELFEPEVVLATSVVRHGIEGVSQVLVHWQGKGPEEATWEDTVTIRNQFPHLNLGDKVEVPEGGIVGSNANDVGPVSQPITRRVYTHRVKRSTALLRGS